MSIKNNGRLQPKTVFFLVCAFVLALHCYSLWYAYNVIETSGRDIVVSLPYIVMSFIVGLSSAVIVLVAHLKLSPDQPTEHFLSVTAVTEGWQLPYFYHKVRLGDVWICFGRARSCGDEGNTILIPVFLCLDYSSYRPHIDVERLKKDYEANRLRVYTALEGAFLLSYPNLAVLNYDVDDKSGLFLDEPFDMYKSRFILLAPRGMVVKEK
jgi:hypothetical protein